MFRKKSVETPTPVAPETPSATPQMDISLKREFELFKMRKILKKAQLAFLSPAPNPEALKTAISQVKTYGFGGVTTLPAQIAPTARLLGEGTKPQLFAAVSYPHGEECVKIKQFSAKNCLSAGADGVVFVACLSPVKRGEFKQVRKEGEKLTAAFGKKAVVKIAFDLSLLTEAESEKLFRALKGAKMKKIVLFASDRKVLPKDVLRVKELSAIPVEVLGEIASSEDVLSLLEGGAEGILSPQMAAATESIAASYNITAQDLKQSEESDS